MRPFVRGDVVQVRFPYTDKNSAQRRPSLLITPEDRAKYGDFAWALMITSARHRNWPGDIFIPDEAAVGLPIPSMVRTAKIATVHLSHAELIGRIDPDVLSAALAAVRARLV
jgi:mRNA interferase MazF